MTLLKDIKFGFADFVKLMGMAFMLMGQYYMLKTEIHDTRTMDKADKQIINYRLTELEKRCNISAIRPKEIKITSE